MFRVQSKQCSTCIYRPDSPLDLQELEAKIADPYGGFKGHRICHHSSDACCAGFWARHKDEFQLGQVAQRLNSVEFVDDDNQRHLLGECKTQPPTSEIKMKLSKALESKVNFTRFCINNKLDPLAVAELRTLVNRRANTWVRQNNQETDWNTAEAKIDRLEKQIDAKAKEMGLTNLDWPGLYPTFTTPAGYNNSMLPE